MCDCCSVVCTVKGAGPVTLRHQTTWQTNGRDDDKACVESQSREGCETKAGGLVMGYKQG